MFTGIVEELGVLISIERKGKSAILKIGASKILEDVHMGDSIAVNGVCLTVTNFDKDFFQVDMMHETADRSGFLNMPVSSKVNLERAMAVNSRFGGHIVSGHVDGQGKVSSITKDENAIWFEIESSPKILRYIVEKGSITVDGISLTVAKVTNKSFSISAIPHSVANTNLSLKKVGSYVNLECDIIGKYIEKLMTNNREEKSGITMEMLTKHGF